MGLELVFDGRDRDRLPGATDFLEVFAAVAGMRNAADGRLVDVTVDALTNDFWQGSGITTPVQWLVWRAGIARSTARRIVTVAARASELPTTLRLLRTGLLSLDQAHAVARYTPGEFEESVCNLAQNATVNQIIAATRTYDFDIEASNKPRRSPSRGVSFGSDDDGTWWAQIRLAAEEGAVVEAALGKVRDELHDTERANAKTRAVAEGRPTTGTDSELGVAQVGWADAMVGMANSILTNGADGAASSARHSVHLHLEQPHPGCGNNWVGELHGGARLPGWLRDQLTCDADINIVWANGATSLSTSKDQRTPPDRLRREIERRDRYQCRVPGCESSLWLQAHHVIHWEHGGETVSVNLIMLCSKHHRIHHQGLLGIVGNADLAAEVPGCVVFTNQHGLTIEAVGKPTPPSGVDTNGVPSGFPDNEPYKSPTGERLQKRWVHFNKAGPEPSFAAHSPHKGSPDNDPSDGRSPHRRQPAA